MAGWTKAEQAVMDAWDAVWEAEKSAAYARESGDADALASALALVRELTDAAEAAELAAS